MHDRRLVTLDRSRGAVDSNGEAHASTPMPPRSLCCRGCRCVAQFWDVSGAHWATHHCLRALEEGLTATISIHFFLLPGKGANGPGKPADAMVEVEAGGIVLH